MRKSDADNNINYNGAKWASKVKKDSSNSFFFSNIWNNQDANSVPFSVIKQRIPDVYHQSWYADINNSPKLCTYCRFKHTFTLQKYLDFISEKK